MILLISQHTAAATTDLMQDWIMYLGNDVVRINDIDFIENKVFSLYYLSSDKRIYL